MFKFAALAMTCLGLFLTSFSAQSEINPFKKAKKFSFGDDVAWYFNEGSAVKSGSRRTGSDTLYYHLNVNKYRLRLRLSKNDPSGELENTRELSNLTVLDVKVDGQRLPKFQWCLNNQERPSDKLAQHAIVINDACVNPGGGDFIIELDEATKNQLKYAATIEFVIEPFNRPISLSYSMANYVEIMARVDKPEPAPVVRSAPVAAPVVKAQPKPKPKPKKQVVKTCYAKPPASHASVVKPVAYPCTDAAKKASATKAVSAAVAAENQKRAAAEAERKRKEEELRKQDEANKKVEAEWEARQTAMWVKRCQKHWSKGKSPCYCQKYMDQAPPGVTDTCGR